MHLIVAVRDVDDAMVLSNSQITLACIRGTATGATQSLLKSVTRIIVSARAGGTLVLLRWCPGHSSIEGGDLADEVTTAAPGGSSTHPTSLSFLYSHFLSYCVTWG